MKFRRREKRIQFHEVEALPLVGADDTGGWGKALKWKALRKGMTPDQVRGLLGEPDRIANNIRHVAWKYGDGEVKFTRSGDEVTGWKAP